MISLLAAIVISMSCPDTNLINSSSENWNAHDKKSLMIAKTRCSKIYTEYKCLKSFEKRSPKVYWVICGKGR